MKLEIKGLTEIQAIEIEKVIKSMNLKGVEVARIDTYERVTIEDSHSIQSLPKLYNAEGLWIIDDHFWVAGKPLKIEFKNDSYLRLIVDIEKANETEDKYEALSQNIGEYAAFRQLVS